MNLKDHIATLKKKEGNTSLADQNKTSILFWGEPSEKAYLPQLKTCVGAYTCFVRLEKVTTAAQVVMYCKSRGLTKVITSSVSLLSKLLVWDKRAAPALSKYAGSHFTLPALKEGDPPIEVVVIPPLKQLVTKAYGSFLTKRIVTKLTNPESWFKPTPFSWELLTPAKEAVLFDSARHAFLVSIDIETFKDNATIRCISYTSFFIQPSGELESESVVLPLDSMYALSIMRKWNWELKAPKVFQNGKYDHSYLARYSAPCYNYLYDTANLFHSWYSELPKDLGFLNAFFIREAMYWKDLSQTNDLHEYYKYNALDTWGTGNAFLSMMKEVPEYALKNYALEFPLSFPCHLCEMTGIARDLNALSAARKEADEIEKNLTTKLNNVLGVKAPASFNVKSPLQMRTLLKILGCGDLTSADAKNLAKARFRHPFNARIINLVLGIREVRTLKEKYLQVGSAAKEFIFQEENTGRILYALNPHGTDSSRLASREHHFWCGLQIQNIPRGKIVKSTLRADPGFLIAEADLEQAESRDTAYISGEEALIEAVEHSPDFHSANASAFFGVPFDKIYSTKLGKVLDKALRDLAKRVNHGANYNMGWYILIETMGEENIVRAKKLLNLPSAWGHRAVAEYLLESFHKTYPGIKETFYAGVIDEICLTHKLTHHTLPEEGWTRYCFGDPTKSKSILNSYIAHPPQSLNAQTLNKAFLAVFSQIAMNPKHSNNFRMLAQIHDSILFQYREGHHYLCDMVKDLMEIPVTVQGYDKKIRTFTVPASVKDGKGGKFATYWSETE